MTLAQLTPGLWEGASARDCNLSLLRGNTKFPFRPMGRERAEETTNGLQSPGANPFLIQLPLLCSFPIYKIGSQQNFCIVAITVLLGTLFPKFVNSWATRLASTVGVDNSASRAGLGHLNSPKMMEFIQRFQTYGKSACNLPLQARDLCFSGRFSTRNLEGKAPVSRDTKGS